MARPRRELRLSPEAERLLILWAATGVQSGVIIVLAVRHARATGEGTPGAIWCWFVGVPLIISALNTLWHFTRVAFATLVKRKG